MYVRGKAGAQGEFGSPLLLDECAIGVIVDWELVRGNPLADTKMLKQRLDRMKDGRFAELQKRRTQTAARNSIFKNGFLGKPLLSKGHANQECEVAWNVLTHNLWVLARQQHAKAKPRAVAKGG